MPWLLYHLTMIAMQAWRDGTPLSKWRLVLDVSSAHGRHPHLAGSRRIVLRLSLYFVVMVAAWIAFTAALGI